MKSRSLNPLRGCLFAALTAVSIFAIGVGVVALMMERTGPVDRVIVVAWINTTIDILMLPPFVWLITTATLLAFWRGARGKVEKQWNAWLRSGDQYAGEVAVGAKARAIAKDALRAASRNSSNDREVINELARTIELAERRLRLRRS